MYKPRDLLVGLQHMLLNITIRRNRGIKSRRKADEEKFEIRLEKLIILHNGWRCVVQSACWAR